MKLSNYKNSSYNLINFEFIKVKFYLGVNKLFFLFSNSKYISGFRNKFSIFEMVYIKVFLKKALKLIYNYHVNNKKILFVGFNDINKWTKFKYLFLKSKHFTMSNFWVYGFLINKIGMDNFLKKNFKKLKNKQTYLELFSIKKTPDLIVFLTNNNFKIPYKEIDSYKIPSVIFSNNYTVTSFIAYKAFGNFTSKKSQIFVYLLLKSILTFSKTNDKK